jgi:hypothetical protein
MQKKDISESLKERVVTALKSGRTIESHDKEYSTCVQFENGKFIFMEDDRMGQINQQVFSDEIQLCRFLESKYSYSAPNPQDPISIWEDLVKRAGLS